MASIWEKWVSGPINEFKRASEINKRAAKRRLDALLADDNRHLKTLHLTGEKAENVVIMDKYIMFIVPSFLFSKIYVFPASAFNEFIITPENKETCSIFFGFSESDSDWQEKSVTFKKLGLALSIQIMAEISELFPDQVKIISKSNLRENKNAP